MNRDGCFSVAAALRLVCTVCVLVACVSPATAALVNKYTFNDNTVDDSVGGMNGTVVDNTGISNYVGGQINLSANNGAGSNQDFINDPAVVGAYVNLPDGIFTSAMNNNAYGAATIELWFTVQENRGWAEALSFGTSQGGEDLSDGNGSYVAIIPQSGTNPTEFRAATRDLNGPVEFYVNSDAPLSPLPTGVQQHVVFVLNHTDDNGGLYLNGTERLYLNGTDVGANEIAGDLTLLSDVNNWLGRSQWGDSLFDGSINELRIYDHAMTPAEVTASDAAGPDPAPIPKLVVNRDTGAISLLNDTPGNVQLKGYSVSSSAGALSPGNWTSINNGGSFDPNGTWTASASTETNLAESVTGGVTDGGTLAPSASAGIGTPWFRTPIEDVTFDFTLGDGTTGIGDVQYTGSAVERSDLNGDNAITEADWAIFVSNAYTDLSGDTLVGAYLQGDLDGDLDNDYQDFQLFKADYIAANGAAAFASLAGAVPEPSSLALAALLGAMLLGTGRRWL